MATTVQPTTTNHMLANRKTCFQTSRPSSGEKYQKTQQSKLSISFGTTLDRKLFPHNCAQDRTGNELTPLKGAPQRGPGVYNNDEISSSIYQISNPVWHPSSITGCYSAFWVFCCVWVLIISDFGPFGHVLVILVVFGSFLGFFGSVLVVFGRFWSFLVVLGHFWSFLVILGRFWSFWLLFGHFGHSLSVFGQFSVIFRTFSGNFEAFSPTLPERPAFKQNKSTIFQIKNWPDTGGKQIPKRQHRIDRIRASLQAVYERGEEIPRANDRP